MYYSEYSAYAPVTHRHPLPLLPRTSKRMTSLHTRKAQGITETLRRLWLHLPTYSAKMTSSNSPIGAIIDHAQIITSSFNRSVHKTSNEASQVLNLIEILCKRISCNDTELKSLHSQVRQLKKERNECSFRVLRFMNPLEVSDSLISDELSSICAGVSNWVEGLVHELKAFDHHWPQLRRYLNCDHLYPDTDTLRGTLALAADGEILMMAVFRAMWIVIFSPILVGASSEERLFLERLCQDMHSLDPKKGTSALNSCIKHMTMANLSIIDSRAMGSWRSDTFRACANSERYKIRLEEACNSLTEEILLIVVLVGGKDDDQLTGRLKRFKEQIAKPAAELATKMRCSTQNCIWIWYSATDQDKLFDFQNRMMDRYDCIDLRTHCLMTKEKFSDLPGDTIIGELIMQVYPVLYREMENTQFSPVIRKGLVLVRTHLTGVKTESSDDFAIGLDNACEKQKLRS